MRTTLGSVALGMIVRDFVSAEPILAFLDNAEKFGHGISHVIVAYSHRFDWTAVLRRRENGTVCLEEIDFVGAHLL